MNIGKEMQKAETALARIERQETKSHELVKARYAAKREKYLLALQPGVRAALRYSCVIAPDEAASGEFAPESKAAE